MQLDPQKKKPGVVTILAGCHGAAVNAVQLLLHDHGLLAKLDALTRDYRYWQSLIRVDRIEPRLHPVTRTLRHTALSLAGNLVETAPVSVTRS
jgi:hypothetical protein